MRNQVTRGASRSRVSHGREEDRTAAGFGRVVTVGGGGLIAIGWVLPWGSIGSASVNGLSDAIEPWFRFLVLGTGCAALAAGLVMYRRRAAWLIGATALVAVGWSLIFPAVVFVAARTAAGYGSVSASTGPNVTHGLGAYLIAAGVIAVVLGCGPASTSKRKIWGGTTVVALLVGCCSSSA